MPCPFCDFPKGFFALASDTFFGILDRETGDPIIATYEHRQSITEEEKIELNEVVKMYFPNYKFRLFVPAKNRDHWHWYLVRKNS